MTGVDSWRRGLCCSQRDRRPGDQAQEMTMLTLTSRAKFRSLAVILALATLGSFAGTPAAALGFPLGKHPGYEVLDACNKVGGVFHSTEAGYGCINENCDGKGGTCKVVCQRSDQTCIGSVPGRVAPGGGIAGILKGTV